MMAAEAESYETLEEAALALQVEEMSKARDTPW
jgi:hypothetical protein